MGLIKRHKMCRLVKMLAISLGVYLFWFSHLAGETPNLPPELQAKTDNYQELIKTHQYTQAVTLMENTLKEAQTNSAQLLRQKYQDLLGVADKKTNLALDLYKANKSGSGGGLSLADLLGASGADTPDGGGSFEEPPYPSVRNASQQLEYPPGSGVIWSSDGNGGWE